MVLAGKVRVNGEIPESPGSNINPEEDIIKLDGKRILPGSEKIYLVLNKPSGYLTTTADLHGRKTVMELFPPMEQRIYPVGRLDKDTEGLLVFTNDGDLSYLLTHPKHHVNKTYLAWVKDEPSEESLEKLCRGIMLNDGMTAPAIVEKERNEKWAGGACLRIIIHEGRKRQVKRMCMAIGHEVVHLKRIQIGSLKLGYLRTGKYRHLSREELEALKDETSKVKRGTSANRR